MFKETVLSLRLYFVAIAALLLWYEWDLLTGAGMLTDPPVPVAWGLPDVYTIIVALGELYIGLMLPSYLSQMKAKYIYWWLWLTFGIGVLLSLNGVVREPWLAIQMFIGGLVTWYIFRNIRRLAVSGPVTA